MYSFQMQGHIKAAQRNTHHEDGDQEADLMVKVAVKRLEGKDDSQIEYHPRQSGGEDGIGNGPPRERRPFFKESRHQETEEDQNGNRYLQAESFKPFEDGCQRRGEEGVPVREAEEDSDGTKVGINPNLSSLCRF